MALPKEREFRAVALVCNLNHGCMDTPISEVLALPLSKNLLSSWYCVRRQHHHKLLHAAATAAHRICDNAQDSAQSTWARLPLMLLLMIVHGGPAQHALSAWSINQVPSYCIPEACQHAADQFLTTTSAPEEHFSYHVLNPQTHDNLGR